MSYLEMLKSHRRQVVEQIETVTANTYSREISQEVSEAEEKIRAKYTAKKKEQLDKLNTVKSGIDYMIDIEASKQAEANVTEQEKSENLATR